ncbi:uncharacterized protein LOC110185865 isoform X1 [Drosophila serrata]|uniref:uncharacterized protein LOC110185865 isoform X1 n=1 Tax=Drosophila serrata TaxID=7274 RepID=UPI000A1D0559|nr:uncharacterized protein LOC110185865 isoform X1 [Drosophila serrata]
MDPQKITELANLMRQNGDKILSSEFTLTLSGSLLRALNDSFTLIADTEIGAGAGSHSQNQLSFQVVKSINAKSSVFPDLQLLHDFVQKTTLLKLTYFPSELHFEGAIDIAKFRALRRLEVHKINIGQVVGIQPLRGQLQHLICIKSLASVDDIITRCGGDNSNGFVWNELKSADFSYNSLRSVDTALEFAQHLQHLSLRHNKLTSVAAIKWLPHLKTLDISYNCLTHVPQFHMEACKRLQLLNISNNYVEELLDVAKLDALNHLDLSDNCLLEHSQLLPLSALVTLTILILQGNPMACNPKHRQATAQYLHKNCATVKFILDFEPLSKAEKSLTGSQKWRYIGSLNNHRLPRSSSVSINSSSASINTSDGSQFSSFGSQRSVSIRGKDYSSEAEQSETMDTSQISRKSSSRIRTVEIEEQSEPGDVVAPKAQVVAIRPENTTDSSHLETKKQIETLRFTYGNEWLKTGKAELMLGMEPTEAERNEARQQFNEFFSELSTSPPAEVFSSTPTNTTQQVSSHIDSTLTPIKPDAEANDSAEKTLYETCDESEETKYESINNITIDSTPTAKEEPPLDKHTELLNLYASSSNTAEDEDPVSDAEPDEETYIVYHEQKPSEALFLTISSNFIREKDTLSERTKTKWSLKILESCERLKSNTLRINFDTMRKDKQERIYCVENTLCQELEKKLRDILAQRDLTDMNITIYRCVNCLIQFTIEQKSKRYKKDDLRCPDCRSVYVAEVTDLSTSLDKASLEVASEPKISPALIVEEMAVRQQPIVAATAASKEDSNSIVASQSRVTNAKNTPKRRTTIRSSANSLNESSSCSKISNSQSSFDSNQSVVGSSNTDRDLEFRANESDVDIISNPSQSSIEVLDPNCVQSASRKTSMEPQPELGSDNVIVQSQSFIEREFAQLRAEQAPPAAATSAPAVAHIQLTESSSSGSVTDSICTSYEQQSKDKQNSQLTESLGGNHTEALPESSSNGSLSGLKSVFQSTNLLMSSSKKLIDSAEATQPYKFNYTNFNEIDHRLKLYFYQCKFKEQGEHFTWLAKGYIYNESTQSLGQGIVVVSTSKLYLMDSFAPPQDDVSKWLRQVVCVPLDRLMAIEMLPWKMGFSFSLKDWGVFLLFLHDMLRTESLLLNLQQNNLPEQCQLMTQSPTNQLQSIASSEPLKMCALLPSCQWSCDQQKKSFAPCLLLITESHLYLSGNGKFGWLSEKSPEKATPEISLTQPMSNLVDVEPATDEKYLINFIDDTESKCEIWQLDFETHDNAERCLNAIGQGWEKLFGVPFSYSGT